MDLEERSRLQSFDLSSKHQNILLDLCVDLGLRGPRVLLQELHDVQDAGFLRRQKTKPSVQIPPTPLNTYVWNLKNHEKNNF